MAAAEAGRSEGPSPGRTLPLALGFLTLLLVASVAGPASASLVERLPLTTLQQRAEAVVVGRVLSTRTVLVDRRVHTVTQLAIDRPFRGPTSGKLDIVTRGGTLGDRLLVVRGTPRFETGENVLVFLFRSRAGWRPVGMFQGVWRLGPDAGELARPSDAGGATLVELQPGPYAVDGASRTVSELTAGLGGGGR